uniref:Uncharacterized protein n=1 Tax=Panagrolaimus sp. PS1159 TaxID=55785 RepID=A0AC35FV59_9BILA
MLLHGIAATNSIVVENYEEKKKLQLWNKLSDFTTVTEYQNEWKNENTLKRTKKSILSLHIEAYENSVKEAESGLIHKQNQFELPRQQNEDQKNEPEVMQFKASQKLLGSNKQKPKSEVDDETTYQAVKVEMKPAICHSKGEENRQIMDQARVALQTHDLDKRAEHDLGAKAQRIPIRQNRIHSTNSDSSSDNGVRETPFAPPDVGLPNSGETDQILQDESSPPPNYQHSPMRAPTPMPSRIDVRSRSVNRGNNSTFISGAAGSSIIIRSHSCPSQSRRRSRRR